MSLTKDFILMIRWLFHYWHENENLGDQSKVIANLPVGKISESILIILIELNEFSAII